MKTRALLLTLLTAVLSVTAFAQAPTRAQLQKINARYLWESGGFGNVLYMPLDTAANAEVGAKAYKNGIEYTKDTLRWRPTASGGTFVGDNMANKNLDLTADRTHNGKGHYFKLDTLAYLRYMVYRNDPFLGNKYYSLFYLDSTINGFPFRFISALRNWNNTGDSIHTQFVANQDGTTIYNYGLNGNRFGLFEFKGNAAVPQFNTLLYDGTKQGQYTFGASTAYLAPEDSLRIKLPNASGAPGTKMMVLQSGVGNVYTPAVSDMGNFITGLSGDVNATGPGVATATLPNTGVIPGTYTNLNATIDAKGRILSAVNGAGGVAPGDTTNRWINDVVRRNDSVFIFKNGVLEFRYVDDTGAQGSFVSNDTVWRRQGTIHYPTPSEQNYAEPTVLYDSNAAVLSVPSSQQVFKMWYTSGWATPQIDYAESLDGRQWTKYSGNPVIYNHCREAIVKDGGNYYIYADSSIAGLIVNRFVSTDGINFTKDHANMITPGATGSWNTTFGNIWVHKDGSEWRMLIDGLCDTLAYTLGLYTSPDGYTWTPYANNPVIRTISAPWFVKKGTRYWLWGHHVGNREYTPNNIFCAYSDDSLKTWQMAPFGAAYSMLTADEGVDSVGGGVGDVCLVEARDSTFMFHAAAMDALHASGESHFKLAIASLPFDSLVKTFQNMPANNSQRWYSQNNKMYYNFGPVGIGTAIPEGALDILENVNTFTPASVDAMNHISTRNNLALFGYNARYYNGRYNRIKPGETAMAIGIHYDGIIADKFADINAAQTPEHLGGWLYSGIFYNQGPILIGTNTDNGLGSVLQTIGHVEFGGNVRSAGTYNGIQVNTGAGTSSTSMAIARTNSALISNTTGDHNTAIGNAGLSANTSGSGNTGVGASSLTLNTTGSYNTAIGQLSMQSLTTGNFNSANGRAALNNLTTGSYNVGIGTLAGTAVTTGDNNIAIGYSSFYTDGTTASSNISGSAAIGYNAQVTQSNSGVLGGLDANGFGMRWGIGVTAPGAWFHLPAGKTTAGFAPLKFTNGEPTTTPAAGQFMYKNGLFIIDSSSSQRDTIATRSWVTNSISTATGGITSINGNTGSAIIIQGGTALSVDNSVTDYVTFNLTPNSSAIPHTLDAVYTTAGNTGSTETDLYTYTLPAGKLAIDGRTMNFEIDGEFNDNTITAQLRLYFSGNVTLNTGAVSVSTAFTKWKLTGYIMRTSSSTAHVTYEMQCPGLATPVFLGYSNLTSLDFTTTNVFKISAQAAGGGASNSDITAHSWQLLYKPQPQ